MVKTNATWLETRGQTYVTWVQTRGLTIGTMPRGRSGFMPRNGGGGTEGLEDGVSRLNL